MLSGGEVGVAIIVLVTRLRRTCCGHSIVAVFTHDTKSQHSQPVDARAAYTDELTSLATAQARTALDQGTTI